MDTSRKVSFLEDTNAGGISSMYLSFDSESTLSSGAFKTVEAITDMDSSEDVVGKHSDDLYPNITLAEEDIEEIQACHAEAINKLNSSIDYMEAKLLRTQPNNFLKNFNALSSTPTKEQLLRTVEIVRGSEADGCMDLGKSFLSKDIANPTFLQLPVEENKENTHPDYEDGSTLCTSSVIETAVSLIEHKMTNLTTDEKILTNADEGASNNCEPDTVFDSIPESKAPTKSKRWLPVNKNLRKSICEPDMLKNRPSRISTYTKKQLSPIKNRIPKLDAIKNTTSDVPKINIIPSALKPEVSKSAVGTSEGNFNRKPTVGSSKSRQSLMPTLQAEKRPFNFKQRMNIVKTTLNSPARKMSRKSVAPSAATPWRKSLLPKKINAADVLKAAAVRRSILQVGNKAIPVMPGSMAAIRETLPKPIPTMRKSLYVHNKETGASGLKAPESGFSGLRASGSSSLRAPDTVFSCSICASSFRVKSLLDAHKRSHDLDVPSLVRKPSSSNVFTNSVDGPKQCKYCDKKFALLRALHIHLMQNCPKIPPNEKRKLHFTELEHEQKAMLPTFSSTSNSHSSSNSALTSSTNGTLNGATKIQHKSDFTDKRDNTGFNREIFTKLNGAYTDTQMDKPSTNKVKKKVAHTGVYRTPNKSIPCHLCKQSFKTIHSYTNHCMIMHTDEANYTSDDPTAKATARKLMSD